MLQCTQGGWSPGPNAKNRPATSQTSLQVKLGDGLVASLRSQDYCKTEPHHELPWAYVLPVEGKNQSREDDFRQSNHIWHVLVKERKRTQRKLKENNLQVKLTYVVLCVGSCSSWKLDLTAVRPPNEN